MLGYLHQSELGVCGWVPLLSFRVSSQCQHIVPENLDMDLPDVDPADPQAQYAVELFKQMDLNNDGIVSAVALGSWSVDVYI